jgi:hypothetical protein
MQWTAPLRLKLAASATIILPKRRFTEMSHGYACTNSVPIRLHSLQVHLDVMVRIAVVLKQKMEPLRAVAIQ